MNSNLTKGSSFEAMNEDLDKRISEIRKKYQDYTDTGAFTLSKGQYTRPTTGIMQDNKYKNYADRSYRLAENEPFKQFD